ncbi:MAG: universal stress protein [Cyclobacteriaceae bacterium]
MKLNLLVLTDFTEIAEAGLKTALQSSKMLKDATIHLLHVMEDDESKSILGSVLDIFNRDNKDDNQTQTEVKNKLRILASTYTDKYQVTITPHVLLGAFKEGLEAFLNKNKMDFVIMGTEGETSVSELLTGNNTTQTIHLANIPVLAVKDIFCLSKCNDLLLLIDDQGYDDKTIKMLTKFIHHFGPKIHLAHILDKDVDTPEEYSNTKTSIENFMMHHRFQFTDLTFIGEKQEIKTIESFIEKIGIDVVTTIASEQSGLQRLAYGSRTDDFLDDLKIPLLSIKEQKYNYSY